MLGKSFIKPHSQKELFPYTWYRYTIYNNIVTRIISLTALIRKEKERKKKRKKKNKKKEQKKRREIIWEDKNLEIR